MKKLLVLLALLGAGKIAAGQADTLAGKPDSVFVTATRTARKLGNEAVPATLIGRQEIRATGSLRLPDILAEQSGLFITNSFGAGVQMQGLNPDYTLILIDGQPVVGRNSGVLDLSRITIDGVSRIEIVKGPSSSLYGSEALAGVINIITDHPSGFGASVRTGSFGKTDISAQGGLETGRIRASLQGNFFRTAGYDLDKSTPVMTQDPYHSFTLQGRLAWRIDPRTTWSLNSRGFTQNLVTQPYVQTDGTGKAATINGNQSESDVNINNSIVHRFSSRVSTDLHVYFAGFRTQTDQYYTYSNYVGDGSYHDTFRQSFTRIEDQTDIVLGTKLRLVAGGGLNFDRVNSNRYDSIAVTRTNRTAYGFAQAEWNPGKLSVIGGLRYDDNQDYQSRLSPKLALLYRLSSTFSLQASFGGGFKAPDFRQLYLNFTNTAAGTGYTVFGNREVVSGIAALQRQGQIQALYTDPASIAPLKPEISTGINAGFTWQPRAAITVQANFFRNDISNLIITNTIAQKTNNMFVYSYSNVNRALTEGVELNASWRMTAHVLVSGGYQYLYTTDKDQLDQIRAGKIFGRDQGVVYQLKVSDYRGLMNRSPHMANVKLMWTGRHGLFADARLVYRSGWGVIDTDGNLVLNRGDQFTNDQYLVNLSVGTDLPRGFSIQAGCNNLLNRRDPVYSPENPGAEVFLTLRYSFKTNH